MLLMHVYDNAISVAISEASCNVSSHVCEALTSPADGTDTQPAAAALLLTTLPLVLRSDWMKLLPSLPMSNLLFIMIPNALPHSIYCY